MSFVWISILFFFHTWSVVTAAPLQQRGALAATSISSNVVDGLTSFTQFARAAYCGADKLKDWKCGDACDANPNFKPTLVGGNGDDVQIYFVGHNPEDNSIIISHEGTDPLKLMSVLTDINVLKGALDPALFPGMPDGVEVHTGFRDEHAITAPEILKEVKRLMDETKSTKVTTIGHSLGGALAELDALFLKRNLPPTTSINAVTYGTPRVGNADFVALFDKEVPDFKRVNHQNDLVPIVPGRFLDFAHPQGEIHLLSDTTDAVFCPGNDNADDENCQIKSVPSILKGSIFDHLGPYNGIHMGTIFC